MNRLLTTLLVWFLMAALPLHAVAAAVELSCAPTRLHQGAHPAAVSEHAALHAVEHATDHSAHAASDAHAHHDGHATTEPGHGDASDGGAAELSHSSCSACSVFCVGAVAPPSCTLSLPSFDGSEAVVIAPADFVTGYIPEGLQRPPRPRSA